MPYSADNDGWACYRDDLCRKRHSSRDALTNAVMDRAVSWKTDREQQSLSDAEQTINQTLQEKRLL